LLFVTYAGFQKETKSGSALIEQTLTYSTYLPLPLEKGGKLEIGLHQSSVLVRENNQRSTVQQREDRSTIEGPSPPRPLRGKGPNE